MEEKFVIVRKAVDAHSRTTFNIETLDYSFGESSLKQEVFGADASRHIELDG